MLSGNGRNKSVHVLPEVHPGNWLPFFILSFFMEIRAHKIHRLCLPRRGRIGFLDTGSYMTPDDVQRFRSMVVKRWEGIAGRLPAISAPVRNGDEVDFTEKARQEMAKRFEILLLLREVGRLEPAGRMKAVFSPAFDFLSPLMAASGEPLPQVSPLSGLNRLCEGVYAYGLNAFPALRLLASALRGRFFGSARGRKRSAGLCLWDGVNLNEVSASRDKRRFFWAVDGNNLRKEDVLFLWPSRGNDAVRKALTREGYGLAAWSELSLETPRSIWSEWTPSALRAAAGALLSFGFRPALRARYRLLAAAIGPAVQHLGPAAYVTNVSALGNESPIVPYLNHLGIRTFMYAYSASFFLFQKGGEPCDFRAPFFTHTLASRLVLWHEAQRRFVASHPQGRARLEVIGPLMAGDESAVFENKKALLQRTVGEKARLFERAFRIGAFDIAPNTKEDILRNGILPDDPYSDENYTLAFLRDMHRLLLDFEDVALVFKPQRNLGKSSFAFSKEFLELAEAIRRHPRAAVLDDDVDPWVPIALSDLAVAIPFTSPALAALHHGRPVLYHDPLGWVRHHLYGGLAPCLTRSYGELKGRVERFRKEPWDMSRLGPRGLDFAGASPGELSSDIFRKLLKGVPAAPGRAAREAAAC